MTDEKRDVESVLSVGREKKEKLKQIIKGLILKTSGRRGNVTSITLSVRKFISLLSKIIFVHKIVFLSTT